MKIAVATFQYEVIFNELTKKVLLVFKKGLTTELSRRKNQFL